MIGPGVMAMEKQHKPLAQRLEEFYGKPIEEILAEPRAERTPEYWMDCTPPAEYFEPVDPYAGPQFSAAFDLQALNRYAREKGVSIADLTREEVDRFKIK